MITGLCRSASTSLLSFRNKYFFRFFSVHFISLSYPAGNWAYSKKQWLLQIDRIVDVQEASFYLIIGPRHASPVTNKIFPRFQCSMSSGSIVPGATLLVCFGGGWHRLADPGQRSGQSLLLRPLTDHKRRLCLECDHKIRYNKFNPCLFDFSSTWRQP